MILFLALGCHRKEADPVETSPETVPYLVEDDTPADEPTFEPATIEAAVNAAIEVFLALDATPVITAYDDFAAEADAQCPAWYTAEDGYPYWYDTCTTGSGTSFESRTPGIRRP